MQMFDTLAFEDALHKTRDGYLVASVRAARTGIQVYAGREVGKPELAMVRVYRPEDEVFAVDSMASMTTVPVTVDHPSEMVDSVNWRKHAVGFTGEQVARDKGFIRVPLIVKDAAAISAIQAGRNQISMGYTCDVAFESGTTPEGETYDAIQRNIRGNHLAFVDQARGGPQLTLGDTNQPTKPENVPMKTLVIDGHTVELSDAALIAVSHLQKKLGDLTVDNLALATKVAETEGKLVAKDGEIKTLTDSHLVALADKDKEIGTLKASIPDAVALDARAVARAELITGAQKILGSTFDGKGKDDNTIRREVVVKHLGDTVAKGMSDDQITGAYSVVVATKADPLRKAFGDGVRGSSTPAESAETERRAMLDRNANRWKDQPAA